MKEFFQRLKEYSHASYRVLLFLAAVLIIANLMPRERKFRFEYSKGEPWRYEVLIAPFDFRIFKTEQELQVERDSILKNFRPYFVYDSAAVGTVKRQFVTAYESKLPEYKQKYKFLNRRIKTKENVRLVTELMDTILWKVYEKGVIGIPNEYAESINQLELMVVKKNLAEPFMADEFFTLRSSYQYIIKELAKGLAFTTNDFKSIEDLISELKINEYLDTNVNLDKDRTSAEKEDVLKNMSLTNGIVLARQKVIEKGEIIDDSGVKKLDSYKKEYQSRVGTLSQYNLIWGGYILVTLMFLMSLFLFLYFYRKDVFANLNYVTFLLLTLCTVVLMAFFAHRIPGIPIWVMPFTILPLIVRTFMDSRLGFFYYVIAMILASFFSDNSFEFIFLQIPAGIAAIFSLYKMARRAQVVRSAIFIFLTYSIFYTGLHLMQEGDIKTIDYNYFM